MESSGLEAVGGSPLEPPGTGKSGSKRPGGEKGQTAPEVLPAGRLPARGVDVVEGDL